MKKGRKRNGCDNAASIDEIAAAARNAGMTYGQYVGKLYAPQITAGSARKEKNAGNTKSGNESYK